MKEYENQSYGEKTEETQFSYDTGLSDQELEDAIRLEVLRSRLGRQVNATDSDISMDKLRSEGWRRCEYQYETFNGLPVYYGGDKYDSDDSEEFFLDTPEEMNNRMQNQSRPDGGDNKSVNMVDVTPKGNMASERLGSEVFNNTVEEDSDTSRTMTSDLDDTDGQMGSHIWDDMYSPVWISAPCMVNSAGQAEELWLNKGEVACMSDFDDEDFTDTDVDSDAVSDMKFDCNTGKSGNPQSDPDVDMCTHAGKKEIVNHAGNKYNPEEDYAVPTSPLLTGRQDILIVPDILFHNVCYSGRAGETGMSVL